MSRSRTRWLPAVGALGLAALGPNIGGTAESSPAPSVATTDSGDARNTDEGRRAIEQAQKALEAKQRWIDGLALESVTATQWSDSSLGCRKPGSQYMQVITSGYTVKFVGKDARREVHVAGDNAVVCTGLARIGPITGRERVPLRKVDAMIAAARTDLASKLGGTSESVSVVNWEAVYLPASVLRCETRTPGVAPADSSEKRVRGYKILLDHRNRTYVYYSDMEKTYSCPRIEAQ